jgi:glycine cleavage system aminomethyltransferase T
MRYLAQPEAEPGWAYGLWRSAFADVTDALGARHAVYNHRLVPVTFGDCRFAGYEALRTGVIIMDASGERALEVKGPDAARYMDQIMCRRMSSMKPGQASYGLMCFDDGCLVSDGVVMRMAEDRYYYVHASAEVFSWMRAHAVGMDVTISDPEISVFQLQGPRSLQVAQAMCDTLDLERFRYFDVVETTVGGLPVILSRTGWTGEIGLEVYTSGRQDEGTKLWRAALSAGEPFGIMPVGLDVLDMRRIEAGIMNYASDFDRTMTPFQAGLGMFVGKDHTSYIGADALAKADRTPLVQGLFCVEGECEQVAALLLDNRVVGYVTASTWSPTMNGGTALVRLAEALEPGTPVKVAIRGGDICNAAIRTLPMFDAKGLIPRGKAEMPFEGAGRRPSSTT